MFKKPGEQGVLEWLESKLNFEFAKNLKQTLLDVTANYDINHPKSQEIFAQMILVLYSYDLEGPGMNADRKKAFQLMRVAFENWAINTAKIEMVRNSVIGKVKDLPSGLVDVIFRKLPTGEPSERKDVEKMLADIKLWRRDQSWVDECFSTTGFINPQSAANYVARGNVFRINGKFQQAVEDFDKAVRLTPQYEYAFFSRGLAYWHLGKIDTMNYTHAVKDFDKAIEIDSELERNYIYRADCFIKLGEHEQAVRDYFYLIRVAPKKFPELVEGCKVLARSGDREAQDFLNTEKIEW